jgi:hypothetical protein
MEREIDRSAAIGRAARSAAQSARRLGYDSILVSIAPPGCGSRSALVVRVERHGDAEYVRRPSASGELIRKREPLPPTAFSDPSDPDFDGPGRVFGRGAGPG